MHWVHLLRGRPQVRLLSGTYCEDAKDVSAKKLSFAFYFTPLCSFPLLGPAPCKASCLPGTTKAASIARSRFITVEVETHWVNSVFQPTVIKFCKVVDVVVCPQCQQLRPVCRLSDAHEPACAVSFCQSDGGDAVLDDQTLRERNTQPPRRFQMHLALVGIASVVVYDILLFQPVTDRKRVKVEINIRFYGSTRQRERDAALL